MTEPTPDTPQEREDKAASLAKELRSFKREIRIYFAVVSLFILASITDIF